MSLSLIDQSSSHLSLESPGKPSKSQINTNVFDFKSFSPKRIIEEKTRSSLSPQPRRKDYAFPEVHLTKSDKVRVLVKLKQNYARKHPGFNMLKYMSTAIPENQEKLLQTVLQPDYEDAALFNKLKYQKDMQKFREKNLYVSIPSKVDSNLKRQPLREYSPQQARTPYSAPMTKNQEHTPVNIYKGSNAFITEHTDDSYDHGPRFTTDNSSGTRLHKNMTPYEFRRGSGHLKLENFHNTSKHSFMSFDMISETSKVTHSKGGEDELYIPKEYSVDKESRFKYLYQQFKDPKVRGKSCSKRIGSAGEGSRGFNRSILEPLTRPRKVTLSKIDENKYESGFDAPVHTAKNNLSNVLRDIHDTGKHYDNENKRLSRLNVSNERPARDSLKKQLLNMDPIERDVSKENKEISKRGRKQLGKLTPQSKPIDPYLQNLKTLFNDYASIKINLKPKADDEDESQTEKS